MLNSIRRTGAVLAIAATDMHHGCDRPDRAENQEYRL